MRLLILENEQPQHGLNELLRIHWRRRAAAVDQAKLAVRAALDPDWPMFSVPVAITIIVYFKNARRQLDASNIPAKLYEDGLIGWLIEDDKPKFVRSITSVSRIDRDRPRVEIEVRAI